MSRPSPGLGLVLSLAFAGGACNDNVTCVFTTGCSGEGGPISDNEAVLPIDGEWIVDGLPEVDSVFPVGVQNPGTTPIVLVFSESMQQDSLQRAIEIVPSGASQPVAGVTQALVSDGRVLVLLPPLADALDPGEYVVRLGDQAAPLDLTGQELEAMPGSELGTFTVAASPPASPRLVTTFPRDGTDNQAETTEIVTVFDRAVLPQSVDAASFDVRVNGVPPLFDPPASPLMIGSSADTRVFLYRSLAPDGRPAPLGTGVRVELRLSPASDPISEQDGGILPAATIDFETLAFAPPLAASLLSDPNDAIGRANLTDGNAEELMVEVELVAAQPDDTVDLFLFGVQKSSEPDSPLIALQNSLRLSGTAPILSATFTREIVPLQFSDDPDDVRLNDGPVTFAFRARRGAVVTPVRLLDIDPEPETIQDVLLDTIVPTIEELVGSTGTSTVRSDQRGLSLAGTADEDLRSVEVTTPMDDNGPLAPVVGTTPAGSMGEHLFLAAPVELGLLPGGGTTYTAVARDLAQNASAAVSGSFTQLGRVGPTPFAPGDSIVVEVFDARTLGPLAGALVLVHSDLGNGVDFPLFVSGTTLADGTVSLDTAGAPSVAAIVTVVRTGFDLFTLHGVPSARLSLPLRASNTSDASSTGAVSTTDPAAVAVLPDLARRFDDSRRAVVLPRGFPALGCTESPELVTCAHAVEPIGDARLGARSFFAGVFSLTATSFQASQLLRAFTLLVPFEPVEAGDLQDGQLEVPFLLDDPNFPEEAAQEVPAFIFQVDAGSGVDLADLADDPETTGEPFVTVETLVPGVPGSIAVAQGLAFGPDADSWTIRAAMPGAITAGGSLGADGRVDTDPFVRVEVLDVPGNSAGVRPRVSGLPAGGPPPVLRALAVPAQLSPAEDAPSGGEAFKLLLTHAIADDRTEPGLYHVELRDLSGRGWDLWRFDPAGSADVEIRVVDVGDAGGVGLLDGDLSSTVSAFAWSALSVTDFLWSDVEREFELFSRAAPLTFKKP